MFRPAPRAVQALPSQRAARLAGLPPACVKKPPTNRLPLPSTASAFTELFTPAPRAVQAEPSHLATRLAGAPPACVKVPPANTLPLPSTAMAFTCRFTPAPRALQALPFQRAMLLVGVAAVVVNCPPTYTLAPLTATTYTPPLLPFRAKASDQLLSPAPKGPSTLRRARAAAGRNAGRPPGAVARA